MKEEGSDKPKAGSECDSHVDTEVGEQNQKQKWYVRRPKRIHIDPLRFPGSKEELGDLKIPTFRMRGMWMHQLGFSVGTWLTVGYDGTSLILTPEDRKAKAGVVARESRSVSGP